MIKRKLKSNCLEAYLELAKWNNEDLVTATGIASLSLSNWLAKSHGPTPRMIDRITAAINERYARLGILTIIMREDILDEILPESRCRTSKRKYERQKVAILSSEEIAELFWGNVNIGDIESCWYWKGSRSVGGYGYLRANGMLIRAHRFAWEITNGSIPDELSCLHKCDKPPCVNPDHLYIGTQKDNMRDMVQRFKRPDEAWKRLFFKGNLSKNC